VEDKLNMAVKEAENKHLHEAMYLKQKGAERIHEVERELNMAVKKTGKVQNEAKRASECHFF